MGAEVSKNATLQYRGLVFLCFDEAHPQTSENVNKHQQTFLKK
jgi:hypothetical protein